MKISLGSGPGRADVENHRARPVQAELKLIRPGRLHEYSNRFGPVRGTKKWPVSSPDAFHIGEKQLVYQPVTIEVAVQSMQVQILYHL
jgi:hypothetical protein